MITWHSHHIIPKYEGGDDSPSNLLKCNVAMHAFMHEQRYKDTGDIRDQLAANGLRGLISKQEIVKELQREGARKVGRANVESGFFASLKTKEHQKMAAKAAVASPNHITKRVATCPHCGLTGVGGNMPVSYTHLTLPTIYSV